MVLDSSFAEQLKQRKVVRWTLAYATAAAAIFGTLESVGQVFAWPAGLLRAVFFLLVAGLGATVVLAWYHGERGPQRVTRHEALLLCAAAVFGLSGATYSLLSPRTAATRPATAASFVLVLPLTDASSDGSQQYLGDGLAEGLRQALRRLQDVRVASSGAAAVQHVTHVLGGTVQSTDRGVRIAVHLTDAAGTTLWAERFDASPAELFTVEDRIIGAVARTLRPRVAAATGDDAPVRQKRLDPVAHDHYLRGEYALKQRTPASAVQAISEYRTASQLDPGHTAAIAREAYAYALFVDWGWVYPGLRSDELLRRGLDLARHAVEQDSLSAEAWLARAYLLQLRDPRLLQGAPDAYQRAVALDPANAEAQHQYAQTLMVLGRYAEAKTAYHAALAVDPERPLTLVPLSAIALREGDAASARRWADSAVALASSAPYAWTSRAQLRLALGDAAGARADAEQSLRIDPSYELPGQTSLAAALATLGLPADAEAALERARRSMVRPDTPSGTEAYYLASALLHMGRRAEALSALETARPRGAWLWFYFQSPHFLSLRSDPRFRSVMESADPTT